MTSGRKDPGETGNAPGTGDDQGIAGSRAVPEGRDYAALFARLRDAARQEEAEISSVPSSFASPLSREEREMIAAAALAALASTNPVGAATTIPAPLGHRRRRPRRWIWPTILVPLAALGVLVVAFRPTTSPNFAPLPVYEVEAHGGLRDTRGAAPEPLAGARSAALQRVAPDTELVIVARPGVAVEGAVAGRAFLIRGDRAQEISTRQRVSPSGSVEIRVRPAGDAALSPGPALLRIVVGRPATVHAASSIDGVRGSDDPNARWLVVPLELVGG